MKSIITLWAGICFLFASIILLGQPPDPDDTGQGNDGGQNEPASNPVQKIYESTVSIQQTLESIASNTATNQQPEDDETNRQIEALRLANLDLNAQQEMAKFTRLIYIVTALGLVIGAVTIFFLGLNFWQTKKIIRQDRGWIIPAVSDKGVMTVGHEGDPDFINFPFKLVNAGKTPALNVNSAIASAPVAIEGDESPDGKTIDDFFRECISKAISNPSSDFIGPGIDHLKFWRADRAMIDALMRRIPYVIYIYSFYETIYGEKYFSAKSYITEFIDDAGTLKVAFRIFDRFNEITKLRKWPRRPREPNLMESGK